MQQVATDSNPAWTSLKTEANVFMFIKVVLVIGNVEQYSTIPQDKKTVAISPMYRLTLSHWGRHLIICVIILLTVSTRYSWQKSDRASKGIIFGNVLSYRIYREFFFYNERMAKYK